VNAGSEITRSAESGRILNRIDLPLTVIHPTMPYKRIDQLPESVRENLPEHAQDIYKEAYNSAEDEYQDPEDRRGDKSLEETAHRVAWSAVKNKYQKEEGQWVKKGD
jgi:cation transport regulator